MPSAAPETAGSVRPVLVAWPEGSHLRAELAADRIPCLLLVQPGDPIPTVVDGEDWIYRDASERDVAARLAALAREGRPAPGPATLPPLGLEGAAHRVASRLVLSAGTFVARRDCVVDSPEELDQVIATLRERFADHGWRLLTVGRAGFLLEPPEGDR